MMIEEKQPAEISGKPPRLIRIVAVIVTLLGAAMLAHAGYKHQEYRDVAGKLLKDGAKLELIRPVGYEIYFAVVIDVLLAAGGIGLFFYRRWGKRLLIAALLITPFYGVYYWWILYRILDNIPIFFYLLNSVAILVIWLFWFLLTKPVRDALLPKKMKHEMSAEGVQN